jgi:hypothetical protein
VRASVFSLRNTAIALFSLPFIYLLFPLVLFDLGRTAYCEDEDNFDGKTVVVGPRPRSLFHPFAPRQSSWQGTEWFFQMYPWVCRTYAEREAKVLSRFQRP